MQHPTKVTIDLDKGFVPTEYEDGGRTFEVIIKPAGDVYLNGDFYSFSQKVYAIFPGSIGFRFEFEPKSIRLLVVDYLRLEPDDELKQLILETYPGSERDVRAVRA